MSVLLTDGSLGSQSPKKALVRRFAKLGQFNPLSSTQVKAYLKAKGYRVPLSRKPSPDGKRKPTTGEEALLQILKEHPNDDLLPKVLEARHLSKASSYLNDERLGRDGRWHPTFPFTPDTGRLASVSPNFTNWPKSGVDEALSKALRSCVIASPGCVLVELDWKAIEAVLTGWFAGDAGYIRLSLLDSHSYVGWHILFQRKVEGVGIPPTLDHPNLAALLREWRKKWEHFRPFPSSPHGARFMGKKVKLATGYGMGPKHLSELLRCSIQEAVVILQAKDQSAPLVAKWQKNILAQAHRQGYLENPFGYRRAFWHVFEKNRDGSLNPHGGEANKVLAFLPQSTAAGMLRETLLRVAELQAELGTFWMLVPIHDAILLEVREDQVVGVSARVREVMEREWPELNGLSIKVDVKQGRNWGQMQE